jgi:hypothetical protein
LPKGAVITNPINIYALLIACAMSACSTSMQTRAAPTPAEIHDRLDLGAQADIWTTDGPSYDLRVTDFDAERVYGLDEHHKRYQVPFDHIKAIDIDKARVPIAGKSVLVISDVGDRAKLAECGLTIALAKFGEFDASSWHLDDVIENRAVDTLNKNGRVKAFRARVIAPRDELKQAIQSQTFSGSQFEGRLKSIASAEHADLILLVRASTRDKAEFGNHSVPRLSLPLLAFAQVIPSNLSLPAYGILQQTLLGIRTAHYYVTYAMTLYDGATGAVISRFSVMDLSNSRGDAVTRVWESVSGSENFGVMRMMEGRDSAAWIEGDLILGPEQAAATQKVVTRLYENFLDKSLRDCGLIPGRGSDATYSGCTDLR